MCYDVKQSLRSQLKYARHHGASREELEYLQQEIEKLEMIPEPNLYHASGFSHPNLIVFTNDEPYRPNLYRWGLIPWWVKDAKTAVTMSNQTLNARGETIFDKPAYREAARKRRCIIPLDGFYEHHNHNKKTYPFHIKLRNDEPMLVAGLWERWQINGDVPRLTVSIVTCPANKLMSRIHNNPKAENGPRMPVILHPEMANRWLRPVHDEQDKKLLQELIKPYDDAGMEAYTVRTLRGKNATGNKPEASDKYEYEELNCEELLMIA